MFKYKIQYTARNGKQVTIRPVEEDDAKQILLQMRKVVEEENFLEEEADTLSSIEQEKRVIREMKEKGSMYTVAEVDNNVVGVSQLFRGQMEMSAHTANFRTWLSKSSRGMGIGKRLLEYTIAWARAQHLEKVCLDVFSNNDRAIELYKKFGFVLEGRRKKQHILNKKYVDEIFMSLFLKH